MFFIIDNILLIPLMLIVTFQPIGHVKTSISGFTPRSVHLAVVVVAAVAAAVVVVVVEFLKYSRTARLAQQVSAAVTLEYVTVIAGEAD